jgi:hypothetical protein
VTVGPNDPGRIRRSRWLNSESVRLIYKWPTGRARDPVSHQEKLGTTASQQINTVGKPQCRDGVHTGEREESLQAYSGSTVDASLGIGARNLNVIEIAEKSHLEESMSQEPEAGGNVEMCQHVLPKQTWNAGCIKISSWTTIKHIRV